MFRNDAWAQRSGETAYNSDDSTADGIEGNHAGQHKREHHPGAPPSTGAVGPYEDDSERRPEVQW